MKNERKDKGGEFNPYLPAQEQLMIASKINRLCDVDTNTFDPDTQVADAQRIIEALDLRIKPHGKISGNLSHTSSSTSEIRSGATNAGNINASFEETKTKKIEFGIQEYRIGNYVAKKYTGSRTTRIEFEHFWDREVPNEISGKDSRITVLSYNTKKSLEVERISFITPKRKGGRFLALITYGETRLWQRKKLDLNLNVRGEVSFNLPLKK